MKKRLHFLDSLRDKHELRDDRVGLSKKWSHPLSITQLVAIGTRHWVNGPCRLQGCKNWPTPIPGWMSYKATKPGLVSVLYLSMYHTVLLFIRAPFYVLLVFITMCFAFWLFWLSYQYLPSNYLKRPLWRSLIVVRWSSWVSPGRRMRMIFLVYCIASLLYYVFLLSPAPTW